MNLNLSARYFHKNPGLPLNAQTLAILDVVAKAGVVDVADMQTLLGKAAATGREPRLASLFMRVTELEKHRLIEQQPMAVPAKGRPPRIFKITEAGRQAIALGETLLCPP